MKLKVIALLLIVLPFQYTSGQNRDIKIKNNIRVESVIDSIGKVLKARYLYQDTAIAIHNFLKKEHLKGSYNGLSTASQLAIAITKDLTDHFNDRHLKLIYAPDLVALISKGSPSGEPSQEEIDQELQIEIYENYRIPELRRLPANIGYIKIDQFLPPRYATGYAEKMEACFQFVKHSDALIIDLRDNPGGYGEGVDFFLSFLLPPSTNFIVAKTRVPFGGMEEKRAYIDTEANENPYLTNPVYVLVSHRTASAAEAVAHVLKYSGRGVIVGEETYGAGYLGDDVPIDENFILTVSYSAGKHPNAPSNWEGTGVSPDIKAKYEKSLLTAQLEAVNHLLVNNLKTKSKDLVNVDKARKLEWEKSRMSDATNPIVLSREQLEEYAGRYESRTIELNGNALSYIRDGRPRRKMIPVGNDEFLFEGWPLYRIGFDRDKKSGKIIGLRLYSSDRLSISQKNK